MTKTPYQNLSSMAQVHFLSPILSGGHGDSKTLTREFLFHPNSVPAMQSIDQLHASKKFQEKADRDLRSFSVARKLRKVSKVLRMKRASLLEH